jgi:hypothetical protein
MSVDFGSSRLFANTTLDLSAWQLLAVGDYVAVDRFMTLFRPNFLHEGLYPKPLSPAQVNKFATDPHFALVYQDATFLIYRVNTLGP